MSDYRRFKIFYRKALTPITIKLIPHDNPGRSLNLNVSVIGVLLSVICFFVGAVYIFSVIPDAMKYQNMEKQLLDHSRKVADFNATLSSLKEAEKDLHQLISLKSKEKIFEKVGMPDIRAFDINQIQQTKSSMQAMDAVKNYLRSQKAGVKIQFIVQKGNPDV